VSFTCAYTRGKAVFLGLIFNNWLRSLFLEPVIPISLHSADNLPSSFQILICRMRSCIVCDYLKIIPEKSKEHRLLRRSVSWVIHCDKIEDMISCTLDILPWYKLGHVISFMETIWAVRFPSCGAKGKGWLLGKMQVSCAWYLTTREKSFPEPHIQ
jgi:hypothetical protein